MSKETQMIRLYKKPTEIVACMGCSSLSGDTSAEPFKLRCGEFLPDEVKEISTERMFSESKATFPHFCPLKNTGRKNDRGLEIRIYEKPKPVYVCMNCPSFNMDTKQTPTRCSCGEFKDEVKQITYDMDLFNKFPDFCPLEEISRAEFEKQRGWE